MGTRCARRAYAQVMGLRRRLRSLDDAYLSAVERKKDESPGFREVSESVDTLFTPSFQVRYAIPVLLGTALLLLVLGAFYIREGASGFGWTVVVGSLLFAALALAMRRVFLRRLRDSIGK